MFATVVRAGGFETRPYVRGVLATAIALAVRATDLIESYLPPKIWIALLRIATPSARERWKELRPMIVP